MREGDRVTWLRVPRGGYGFVEPVPATVVRAVGRWVTLDAELRSGGVVRVVVERSRCSAAAPEVEP